MYDALSRQRSLLHMHVTYSLTLMGFPTIIALLCDFKPFFSSVQLMLQPLIKVGNQLLSHAHYLHVQSVRLCI